MSDCDSCPLSYALYGINRLTAARAVGATTMERFNRRFRSRALLVRICLIPDLRRTTLPVPVRLNRLLAPLCVFSFCPAIVPPTSLLPHLCLSVPQS